MKAIIYNYKIWVNSTEVNLLVNKLNEIILKVNYKVLNYMEHKFNPQGYTSIWLLAESHLALHTFPEENKSYIELSSCNKDKNKAFSIEIAEWLKSDTNIGYAQETKSN